MMDDKLKDVLNIYGDNFEHFNNADISLANAIAQIKQVFADEGYVYHAQSDSFKTTTLRMGLMTGQEWYEQFKKDIQSLGAEFDTEYEDMILEAARKASGMEG